MQERIYIFDTTSMGMIPPASLGARSTGVFEPVHGSAPDINGKDLANQLVAVLSCGMMLKYGFNMEIEANAIFEAVNSVLDKGCRTFDIMQSGMTLIGTEEMGSLVAESVCTEYGGVNNEAERCRGTA